MSIKVRAIQSAVAEHDREMISKRTKEALMADKARGVQLGNPENFTKQATQNGRKLGLESRIFSADSFAVKRYPYINQLLGKGFSLRAIAERLNGDGVLTARGLASSWTATAIINNINRVE